MSSSSSSGCPAITSPSVTSPQTSRRIFRRASQAISLGEVVGHGEHLHFLGPAAERLKGGRVLLLLDGNAVNIEVDAVAVKFGRGRAALLLVVLMEDLAELDEAAVVHDELRLRHVLQVVKVAARPLVLGVKFLAPVLARSKSSQVMALNTVVFPVPLSP